MQAQLASEDEDILQTIDLTSKLQKSLRKLLSKKKSLEINQFTAASPPSQKDQSTMFQKLEELRQQNKQLYLDNQQLNKQILALKEQLRQSRKQLQGAQKYVDFLQSYNQDLKKELLYWMKGNKAKTINDQDRPLKDELLSKIKRLRQENEQNQLRLQTVIKTESNIQNSSVKSQQRPPLSFDLSKFKRKHSEVSRQAKKLNDCTSCNYKSKSKSKDKRKKRQQITGSKQKLAKPKVKNLKNWHKNYLSKYHYVG